MERQLAELQAKVTDRRLVVTFGDVLFASGGADLKAEAAADLSNLSAFLAEHPARTVVIEGHTDSLGAQGLVKPEAISGRLLRRESSLPGPLARLPPARSWQFCLMNGSAGARRTCQDAGRHDARDCAGEDRQAVTGIGGSGFRPRESRTSAPSTDRRLMTRGCRRKRCWRLRVQVSSPLRWLSASCCGAPRWASLARRLRLLSRPSRG
jgi:hypothetical protein